MPKSENRVSISQSALMKKDRIPKHKRPTRLPFQGTTYHQQGATVWKVILKTFSGP